jgi:hypothetical protein
MTGTKPKERRDGRQSRGEAGATEGDSTIEGPRST